MFSTFKFKDAASMTQIDIQAAKESLSRGKGIRKACNSCRIGRCRCSGQKNGCDRCREKKLQCVYEETSSRSKRRSIAQDQNISDRTEQLSPALTEGSQNQTVHNSTAWSVPPGSPLPNHHLQPFQSGTDSIEPTSFNLMDATEMYESNTLGLNSTSANSPELFNLESHFGTSNGGYNVDAGDSNDTEDPDFHSLMSQNEPFPFAARICEEFTDFDMLSIQRPTDMDLHDVETALGCGYEFEYAVSQLDTSQTPSRLNFDDTSHMSSQNHQYTPSSTESSPTEASQTKALRPAIPTTSPVPSCGCMTKATSLLEELEDITTQSPTQSDSSLKLRRRAMLIVTTVLDCALCRKTNSLVALLVLVVDRLISAINPVCQTPSAKVRLRLGEYDIDHTEEWPQLARCLMSMQLDKLRHLLRRLWAVAEGPSYSMHREMLSRACNTFRRCWDELNSE